ncbi:hypothetical protein ACIA5D_28230 [Actinoplanes sp. NPDC051513]|uniref:hypothetical protein n=1 Tax=Actinoplanes sp. NPDC051513 TaxID=3363908 RepID=UPI0037B21903
MAELDDVMGLLGQVIADPGAFGQRLAEQAVARFAQGGDPGGAPADRVVDMAAFAPKHNDSSVLLAAALGACDCWGAEVACPTCHGEGAAGWAEPDVALFQKFVGPAVERLSAVDRTSGGNR